MKKSNVDASYERLAGCRVSALVFFIAAGLSFGNSIGGYVEELSLVSFPSGGISNFHADNLLQFRMNAKWYPWSPLAIEAAGRALWYCGRDFKEARAVASALRDDPGYLNLTRAQGSPARSSVLYETIDRLSAECTKNNLSATIGRQRINWGTNLVWNPNDWFNAFNYLDFSYPEHPGTDAVRVQYYPDALSVAEVAVQPGRAPEDRTFAALYKLNKWSYDWQFQTGLSGRDAAAGFSWAGAVKGAGFRGELAGYYPAIDRTASATTHAVASLSSDYTFPSSLYFQVSGLYNGFGTPGRTGAPLTSQSRVSAKSLLPARYALFGETAYQLTPLVRLDVASLTDPIDGSFCFSTTVFVSVVNNVDAYALGQVFSGREGDLFGSTPDMLAVSLKWSF